MYVCVRACVCACVCVCVRVCVRACVGVYDDCHRKGNKLKSTKDKLKSRNFAIAMQHIPVDTILRGYLHCKLKFGCYR